MHPKVKGLIGLGILFLVIGAGIYGLRTLGDNVGYSPVQPIPFSHKGHAGEFNIPCLYCHASATKSKHATVPAMNVCMNCHSVVAGESPHIQRLKEMVAKGEEIEWIRIHDLPDFVYFNHKRHIAAGISCETCHGPVQDMKRVKQVAPLTMGWCVECHRANKEKGAKVDCNVCHN